MAEWISVKDRLPEFVHCDEIGNTWTDAVLAWDGKELSCGEFTKHHKYSQIDYEGITLGEVDGYPIYKLATHWMPLPESPEGE